MLRTGASYTPVCFEGTYDLDSNKVAKRQRDIDYVTPIYNSVGVSCTGTVSTTYYDCFKSNVSASLRSYSSGKSTSSDPNGGCTVNNNGCMVCDGVGGEACY